VLEDARPGFASIVQQGDFVVGGKNFGQGSSREHAPTIIKMAGVSAVIAKSFPRIFFRNCINVGLPALIIDTDKIDEGDELELDLLKGKLANLSKGVSYTFPPLPRAMANILADGGLVEHIKKHGDFKLD
jgi:3-isopropylmalate/(R)-2-methylmalate dehydratase small subunit